VCDSRRGTTLSKDKAIRAPPYNGYHMVVWPEGVHPKVVVLPGLSNSSRCCDGGAGIASIGLVIDRHWTTIARGTDEMIHCSTTHVHCILSTVTRIVATSYCGVCGQQLTSFPHQDDGAK
jgi:hypothetical protein